MDYFHFQTLSFPIIQIFILMFFVWFYLKNFLAKKIQKTQMQKIFENMYLWHSKSQTFENLPIDKNLKVALEKYFFLWDKSQKQNILNLWKKYLK